MSKGGFVGRQRKAIAQRNADSMARAVERNVDVPRGRPVKTGDVSAYALGGHSKCRGTGMVGAAEACSCATKRFMRAHPEVIVVREGDLLGVYWPLKVAETEAKDGGPDGQEGE